MRQQIGQFAQVRVVREARRTGGMPTLAASGTIRAAPSARRAVVLCTTIGPQSQIADREIDQPGTPTDAECHERGPGDAALASAGRPLRDPKSVKLARIAENSDIFGFE
ncbi:hypothetical protein [Microbacterium candidum]|uniref:Uncharacterized protein n=1 Tax=Microbacterium candidum TaxID=3041922 RepID=A0ABT7MW44_9MICO|nr:hypothetical protein [Microbacterium sp. ASV49]MDL9978661.1 hypothetical protein [Microbacterium sp. ASV49]